MEVKSGEDSEGGGIKATWLCVRQCAVKETGALGSALDSTGLSCVTLR